jgi:hypothetical protein
VSLLRGEAEQELEVEGLEREEGAWGSLHVTGRV